MKNLKTFEEFLNESVDEASKSVEITKGPHKGKSGILVRVVRSKKTRREIVQVQIGDKVVSVPPSAVHIKESVNEDSVVIFEKCKECKCPKPCTCPCCN
jgi:hypothetical protein